MRTPISFPWGQGLRWFGLSLALLVALLLPQGVAAQEAIGDITITSINCNTGLIQGEVPVTNLEQALRISYVGVGDEFFGAGGYTWTPPSTPYTGTVPLEFTIAGLATGNEVWVDVALYDFSQHSDTSVPVNCATPPGGGGGNGVGVPDHVGLPDEAQVPANPGPPEGLDLPENAGPPEDRGKLDNLGKPANPGKKK